MNIISDRQETEHRPNTTEAYIAVRNLLHFTLPAEGGGDTVQHYLASGVYWVHPAEWDTNNYAGRPVHEVMIFRADTEGNVSDWTEVYCERYTVDVHQAAELFANLPARQA